MYEVSEDKLQELNVIVGEKGGTIPSKVSDALAALEVATASGDKKEAKKQFTIAVEANKLNGAAWSDVQTWHDDVKEGDDTGPVDPPGPPAGAIQETPVLMGDGFYHLPDLKPRTGNHTFPMEVGKTYTFRLAADGFNTSYSRPGGSPCQCAWGPSAGSMANPQGGGNGTAISLGPLPAGNWFTFWLGAGSTPVDNCLYSAQ
jgi:hypothetical protein